MRFSLACFVFIVTLILLLTPRSTAAQDIKDTLFYDARWQLCEQTPASYYRIGTMRIDSLARYIGPVTDYYRNGQVEMKATYSPVGDLDGEAVFYYPNGQTKMRGHFTTGQMTGQWFCYAENGILRAILDCKDENNFTPLFLSNKKGKKILQDGNGRFTFRTIDFTAFVSAAGYEIEGVVRNGLKDGTWEYSADIIFPFHRAKTHRTFITEQYVRGKFIRAVGDPNEGIKNKVVLHKPFSKITLYPPKLLALDMLKSDFVFAPTKAGKHQLRAFLVAGIKPVIEEAPASPDQNFALFTRVICNALMKKEDLAYQGHSTPGRTYSGYSYQIIRTSQDNKSRYDAGIRFTILPDQTIGNLEINGRIDDRSRELLSHYLPKIRNLYVSDNPQGDQMALTLQTRSVPSAGNQDVIVLSRFEPERH
jgi:hypothetical protein